MYSKPSWWNSLEIQWISIHLPMREMWVRSRVREESTCRGATKLVCHNYWGPRAHRPGSTARGATTVRSLRTTVKSSPCSPQLGKARVQQQRPSAAKKKKKICYLFQHTNSSASLHQSKFWDHSLPGGKRYHFAKTSLC